MPATLPTYLVLLPLLTLTAAEAPPADLPQYSLPVGRKLSYSLISESRDKENAANTTRGTLQLTVVRENSDSSRRVIFRSSSSYQQGLYRSPERVSLAYGDVFPDGRVLPNASLSMQVDLSAALPRLPKDQTQLKSGWSEQNDAKLQTMTFKTKESESRGDFTFTAVQDSVMNKIYAMTHENTYHFDLGKGIVTSVHSTYSQDYGFHQRGLGTTKLESDQMIDAAEIATLAADFDLFFNTTAGYEEMLHDVNKHPEHADATLAAAKDLLEKARTTAKTADVRNELSRLIVGHADSAKYIKESADQFKDLLNKPAATWESTDLDGKPVKLADFHGKVVVMDFWYRGCGWCMYAMPQVLRLSHDYKDKPVIVLGMNTDREEADARFVIKAMSLDYPTIKAEGIPQKYAIQGFPTLLIVDQQGILRDVHVGYSANLREEVSKKIDELLAAK